MEFLEQNIHHRPNRFFERTPEDTLQPHMSILKKVRNKLTFLTFAISAFASFVMAILRIYQGRMDVFIISTIGLVISVIWIFVSRKGYQQLALILASFTFLIMAFYEGLTTTVDHAIPFPTFCYFSLVPAIISMLLDKNWVRILVLTSYTISFLLLTYLTESENITNMIIWLMISVLSLSVLLFFIKLMENQEENIQHAIAEKNAALQQLEAKQEELLMFNNRMNHDIKAPLRSIKGFATLLHRKTELSDEQKKYLKFIENSSNSLENLITDLLILSKASETSSGFELISINQILNQVIKDLSFDIEKDDVAIEIEAIPEVFGNTAGVKTVFLNLLSNAIKYHPDEPGHNPRVQVMFRKDEHFDTIIIQDNGIGIHAEYLDKLFTPFVRSSQAHDFEGTGLGMAICKKVMDNHKGQILYIENDKGGACFEVKFPSKTVAESQL